MKKYEKFRDLFDDIRQIKRYVVNLKGEKLGEYRDYLYSLPFQEWRIDILWEYIWDDKSYCEICRIFKIKVKGDNLNES